MYYVESACGADDRRDRTREALLSRVLTPAPVFTLHDRECEQRAEVERFVADKFRDSFRAEIHEFLPLLLSMRCLGKLSGVVGLRKAAAADLFLEQYLEVPVESRLGEALGTPIDRADIVEIGNLVAGRKGPSQFIFLIATSILHQAGFKWIAFTATRALTNNLHKLGFPMVKLADASVDCLPEQAASEWGEYYKSSPQVMAGALEEAMAIANRRPLFKRVMQLYGGEIQRLAQAVRESRQ